MGISISILFGLGVVAALAYLPLYPQSYLWSKTLIKTIPMLSIAAAAALANGPALLALALFLSAAGDFALSRPGRMAFMYGLAAFSLAHVLYMMLFLGLSDEPLWAAFAIAPIPAITMLFLAVSTETWLTPFAGALRWPVRIYVVLIGAMALAALTLPSIMMVVTIGAIFFVLSDVILSLRLFRLDESGDLARHMSKATWVFYIAGQMLIFWGVLSV